MSALALETSRFAYLLVQHIYSFFGAIANYVASARQQQANYEIAKILYNSGDYRNESFEYILKMINEGRVYEISSK
jgi:hypothetical protein